ncbi:uncharacterized protein B0I36DRAFT_338405 [Microdochium trichocladiopsis]|uniref:Zn(2)-C6 fungal-type domain-containing protein n=1 Tax=Microdochium trichocladiopsis TaxID=1682393 RepID=A0A9P9BIA6_9PEZI|nr:uncharacterized protein B0I36DRAFT_338405 [Microdochium trichocladiopsis]KAH7014208.1 hypothetical protein B0I36DRAFT_338405 [Microdochium trichocladiopsis]
MVYFGPSKGCLTCRQRRKKCDEARPSCGRCIKSRRTCRGYEDTDVNTFRPYIQSPATGPSQPSRQNNAPVYPSQYYKLLQVQQQAPTFISEGRRCTLPARVAPPGSTEIPEDFRGAEVTESARLQFALRGFFYDYCVITTNTQLSRGFLSNVELMTRELGLDSHLVKACEAVACAVHGKTLNRPNLVTMAETRYQDLLGELAQLIDYSKPRDEREPWLVAMLLGVYQIVHASEEDPGSHLAHSRGLAALLGIAHSPLALLQPSPMKTDRSPDATTLGALPLCSFFIAPSIDPSTDESLDGLALATHALWNRHQSLKHCLQSQTPTLETPLAIKDDAIALERRFQHWQQTRAPEFHPVASGDIPDLYGRILDVESPPAPEVGYWPGRVDSYFDHYVAGVWNVFRATRLLVLYLIITLEPGPASGSNHSRAAQATHRSAEAASPPSPPALRDHESSSGYTSTCSIVGGTSTALANATEDGKNPTALEHYTATGHQVVRDILSSIPYSLTDKLPVHMANACSQAAAPRAPAAVHEQETSSPAPPPPPPMDTGRVSGGLLLMHPLHVAINMPFVQEDVKAYMRRTLEWIGTKGGVGQAGILAKADGVLDLEYLSSSCLIIWAGFLG